MSNITIFDPSTRTNKTIAVTIEAALVIQDQTGEMEFFMTLSTQAKDVSGHAIPKRTVKALSEGAGGTGLDRNGNALAGGKYADLSAAAHDYIAMMVRGVKDEPWTEMAFS